VDRAPEPVTPRLAAFAGRLRVGVLDGWFQEMAGPEARAAVAAAADGLGAPGPATLAGAQDAGSAAFLITAAAGGNLHRRTLAERPQDFDPAIRGRLLAGLLLPADAVAQAQRVRRRVYAEALRLFERFDLLLAPATPVPAPRHDEAEIALAGRIVPTRPNLGVLTQPISCLGLPVVAAPIAAAERPIGVQLIAPPWREDLALIAAQRLEGAGVARAWGRDHADQ